MHQSTFLALALVVSCDQSLVDQFPQAGAPGSTSPTSTSPSSPPAAKQSGHGRCGYIGYGDDVGYDTFKANADAFDVIHPDWYKIDTDGLTVTPLRGANDARVLDTAHEHGIPVIPLVAGVDD